MSSVPYHHRRLSALDALLLSAEDATSPMHVAAVLMFEGGPLRLPDGSLDVEPLRTLVASRLASLPRYRQRIERVPLIDHPVWVDDDRFELAAHVRHVVLPRPGTEAQLQALVGDLFAGPLDRSRPLWEVYLIDGLQGGRFAFAGKVHHCIVDGVLGAALIASVLQTEPDDHVDAPAPWEPRPAPPPAMLLEEEIRFRGQRTVELLRRGLSWLDRGETEVREGARQLVHGLLAYLKAAVPASHTPFNPDRIGPRRAFRWLGLDMARVKALKARAGCTVNDVVLAVVAGGVRRFLQGEGFDVAGLDFRVMVPVSEHGGEADLSGGNRVSLMLADLPVDVPEPVARLGAVVREMGEAKESRQADLARLVEEVADWGSAPMLAEVGRGLMRLRPFNMIVTNVPGPPMPLYMLGARLLGAYPLVPLFVNTAVGIALLSNGGRLDVGINADPEAVPEVDHLVDALRESFEELDRAVPVTDEAPNEAGARRLERPHPPRG